MHGLRSDDKLFNGFSEAYFSKIKFNAIKGWKLHKKVMNLIVPFGKVRFVLFDDRNGLVPKENLNISSEKQYSRLTVPPNIWFAFMGMSRNDSDIKLIKYLHDDNEVEAKLIDEIDYD